jgi:hypothetical protein
MMRLIPLWVVLGCSSGISAEDTPEPDTGTQVSTDTRLDSAMDSGTGPLPVYELEAGTVLYGDSIALQSNLPAAVTACEEWQVQAAPCEDVDLDGLVDAWEDMVLDRLRPSLRYDEDEPLMGDASAVLHMVGRVAPASDASGRVRVFIMVGYSLDYGRCDLSAHDGDSERVVLDLELTSEESGDAVLKRTYTAAHEGTSVDHGAVMEGPGLVLAEFPLDAESKEPRWRVYASDGKHAIYHNVALCEGAEWAPCLEEDCEPDGVEDASLYERLPEIVNAGEEEAPRLSDLTEIGFPDEDAWLDQTFCGGQGRGEGCASAVRDKLLADPFDPVR